MKTISNNKGKKTSRVLSAALAVTLTSFGALSLTACGEDAVENTSNSTSAATSVSFSGEFAGSGASSTKSAVEAWVAKFEANNDKTTVTYDPKGSGGGRKDLVDGAVVFAGSDSPLKDAEITDASNGGCKGGAAFEVPVYVSPIDVIFNLEGVSKLNLTASTIAKIFDGKITTWDDPEIIEHNPDVNLPNVAITPVHRSDESGTTENFTDYLNKASEGSWRYEKSGSWPVDAGQSGKGSSGMAQVVSAAQGTIGYVDDSQAGKLGKVSIGDGVKFVTPSADEASKAVAASKVRDTADSGRVVVDIDRTLTADQGYPLVLVSYDVACTYYKDEKTAEFVKAWLKFITSSEGQKLATKEAGSAPLPETLTSKIEKSIDLIH
jgi:phosphate transport system substrate-binding protein